MADLRNETRRQVSTHDEFTAEITAEELRALLIEELANDARPSTKLIKQLAEEEHSHDGLRVCLYFRDATVGDNEDAVWSLVMSSEHLKGRRESRVTGQINHFQVVKAVELQER